MKGVLVAQQSFMAEAQVRAEALTHHTRAPATLQGAMEFSMALIEATKEIAAAYKPNAAFFESFNFVMNWFAYLQKAFVLRGW